MYQIFNVLLAVGIMLFFSHFILKSSICSYLKKHHNHQYKKMNLSPKTAIFFRSYGFIAGFNWLNFIFSSKVFKDGRLKKKKNHYRVLLSLIVADLGGMFLVVQMNIAQ